VKTRKRNFLIDILDWYNNQRKKDGQNNHVVVRGKKKSNNSFHCENILQNDIDLDSVAAAVV
jgi:hypothetical protein